MPTSIFYYSVMLIALSNILFITAIAIAVSNLSSDLSIGVSVALQLAGICTGLMAIDYFLKKNEKSLIGHAWYISAVVFIVLSTTVGYDKILEITILADVENSVSILGISAIAIVIIVTGVVTSTTCIAAIPFCFGWQITLESQRNIYKKYAIDFKTASTIIRSFGILGVTLGSYLNFHKLFNQEFVNIFVFLSALFIVVGAFTYVAQGVHSATFQDSYRWINPLTQYRGLFSANKEALIFVIAFISLGLSVIFTKGYLSDQAVVLTIVFVSLIAAWLVDRQLVRFFANKHKRTYF